MLAPIFKQNRLPEPLKNLPESLVEGKRHVGARQKRRRMQLKYRVQQHPIIFLQGEACAGKTFMAKAVASDIHHDKPAKIIQLGPNTKAGELFGSQKLMSYCVKTGEDDQRTEFCNGPILEWACSENPPLLILDEANLAPQGLLAPLIGLTQDPPILHYRGRHYPLTEKHRVIMTGNPDSYQGRGLDQLLHGNVPTLFYHPLTDDELADNIILPKLPASLSEPMKKLACQRLLTLFNQFKTITTDNLITPRDIIDVLSLINLIERCQTTKTDWNEAKINALVHRAFIDSVGDSLSQVHNQSIKALEHWYQGQFCEDTSVLTGINQQFDAFYTQLKQNNQDANLTPQPVKKLVYHYWLHLEKNDYGRPAMLVEGAAGWGKDFILRKTVELWQQQKPYVHINANLNQWETLVKSVTKAQQNGCPMAISELNLVSSNDLEGLFNNLLTGNAKPGFRLFATVNP